ncbi:hypothetical protein BDQ17DRAFT_1434297 [Cyathus striatus]|nr:hypothetical protein BDQ17DRAFT_1434297 [Cyathus striatus]
MFRISYNFKVKVPQKCWQIRGISTSSGTSSSMMSAEEEEYFYRNTSTRWFQNEKHELQQRYLKYNIPALKKAAVDAVEGAKSVVNFNKLEDAGFNKLVTITIDNGQDVVARLACSNVGPVEQVVESEVATMEFACTRLGLPVPRVLGWCSKPEATDVSAAYIIMENVKGDPIFMVWDSYGSIYYHDAIKDSHCIPIDDTYALGPALPLCMNNLKRDQIDVSRGPWTSVKQYLHTVFNVEKQWIEKHASPESLRGFQHSLEVERDPAAHIALVERIESLIPHLILKDSPDLITPILWHPEFSAGDIMISYDGLRGKSKQMVTLIDWQHSSVLPLYLQAKPTQIFLGERIHYGPQHDKSPSDNSGDSSLGVERYLIKCLKNEKELAASLFSMTNPIIVHFKTLVNRSYGMWEGSFMRVRKEMVELEDIWPKYFGNDTPFPSPTSPEQRKLYQQEYEEWSIVQKRHMQLCDKIGVTGYGWVRARDFELAYFIHNYLKNDWILSGKSESDWPFEGPDLSMGVPKEPWKLRIFGYLQKLRIMKVGWW